MISRNKSFTPVFRYEISNRLFKDLIWTMFFKQNVQQLTWKTFFFFFLHFWLEKSVLNNLFCKQNVQDLAWTTVWTNWHFDMNSPPPFFSLFICLFFTILTGKIFSNSHNLSEIVTWKNFDLNNLFSEQFWLAQFVWTFFLFVCFLTNLTWTMFFKYSVQRPDLTKLCEISTWTICFVIVLKGKGRFTLF